MFSNLCAPSSTSDPAPEVFREAFLTGMPRTDDAELLRRFGRILSLALGARLCDLRPGALLEAAVLDVERTADEVRRLRQRLGNETGELPELEAALGRALEGFAATREALGEVLALDLPETLPEEETSSSPARAPLDEVARYGSIDAALLHFFARAQLSFSAMLLLNAEATLLDADRRLMPFVNSAVYDTERGATYRRNPNEALSGELEVLGSELGDLARKILGVAMHRDWPPLW